MIRAALVWMVLALCTQVWAIGADFELTDQHGQRFRLSEHQDKVVLLFFGYTHCPDICPDTLSTVAAAVSQLEQPDQVQVVFISVDPARDTPEHLRRYLAYFDDNTLGLSGTEHELKAITQAWNARYKRVKTREDNAYLLDHSADIYVIEKGGTVHAVVPYGLSAQHLSKVLRGALSVPAQASQVDTLLDLDGNAVPVKVLAAGPKLLHFWASWCVPCREEFAELASAKSALSELSADFYAINLGDNPAGIERFLQDFPIHQTVLRDPHGRAAKRWGVHSLPQTLLIGEGGEVQERLQGAQAWTELGFVERLGEMIRAPQ